MKTRPVAVLAALASLLAAACAAPAPAAAEALLLIEAASGKVLHAENATHPWYPASVTKMMTLYVTLRAVKENRITLDTLITVTGNAVAQAPSKMGFRAGTQLTVDNAMKMMMVKSANDMAVVLAEGVAGSIDNFSTEMNQSARRLGMTQTTYVNPNGLPADGQVTSARDLAILARALIREFPEYDLYWHIPSIKLGRRVMRNTNRLIDSYPGADGMKTGFICASGFNLVGVATRNGRRLIAVVLGAHSGAERAEHAAQLLEKGFTATPLSWLMPSLGAVETLTPVNVDPPNLRDEMCGPNRRHRGPATDDDNSAGNDSSSAFASLGIGFKLNNGKGASLLSARVESRPPIPVYLGPARNGAEALVSDDPAPKPKRSRIAKTHPKSNPAPKADTTRTAAQKNNKGDTRKPNGAKSNGAMAYTSPSGEPAPAGLKPPPVRKKKPTPAPKND